MSTSIFNWLNPTNSVLGAASLGVASMLISCSSDPTQHESPKVDMANQGAQLELAQTPMSVPVENIEPAAVPPKGAESDPALEGKPRMACNDAFGLRAVTIQWATVPQGAVTHLEAVVRNNTDAAVTVDPEVLGASPHTLPARRSLERLELAPREERRLSVPVTLLPVQTEGSASAIELGVKWIRPLQEDMVSPASVTGAVFVTHVAGKADQATVLTSEQELAAHQSGKTGRRPTQLRRYDASTGVMQAKASAELASLSEVSVGFTPVEVTP